MSGAGNMAGVGLSARSAATTLTYPPEVGNGRSLVQGGSQRPATTRGGAPGRQHASGTAGSAESPTSPPAKRPSRRRFTAEYKLRILHEADQCAQPGELGALLRREGLYSSHLCAWRRQREAGARAALAPKKRGRKPAKRGCLARENRLLQREARHLRARLRQAEMMIAMQARVAEILGIPQANPAALPVQGVSAASAPRSEPSEPSENHRRRSI